MPLGNIYRKSEKNEFDTMKRVLVIDGLDKLSLRDYKDFDQVVCLNEGIKKEIKGKEFLELDLYSYFISSHKMARDINKRLLAIYNIEESLHLSLLKLSDSVIYDCARLIVISMDLSSHDNQVLVLTNKSKLILSFIKILGLNLIDVKFKSWSENKKRLKKDLFKLFLYMIDYFKLKENNAENIFVIYNDKVSFEYAKPYLNEVMVYPFFCKDRVIKPSNYSCDKYLGYKMISPKIFLSVLREYVYNMKNIKNNVECKYIKSLYLDFLFFLEIEAGVFLTLKEKSPKLKKVLGAFDAYSSIDYVTYRLNKMYNIKTICIPHGINFKEKVNYISLGVNTYTFWSENHLKRMGGSNISKKYVDVSKIITGSSIYHSITKNKKNKKNNAKKILVIGEYFSNDFFYSSPFNENTSRVFFNVLTDFVKNNIDSTVTIRTRLNDGYYNLALQYACDNIVISTSKNSIVDEINNHNLVISVFSNALHEGLILEKDVLQVNLLKIENYRDLAAKKLVHYANTEESFSYILKKWYQNELRNLDFDLHLKEYANNGDFKKIKLR
jgi:hypothetical protein